MHAAPLTVVATMKARPGLEAEVRRTLLALIAPTRQEPGCLSYELHQAVGDPATFLFHESWTSKQHLDDHLARPHLAALLARADALFAAPPQITLWEKIG